MAFTTTRERGRKLESLPSADETFSELENEFPIVREKLLSLRKRPPQLDEAFGLVVAIYGHLTRSVAAVLRSKGG
jgi:hypothetical protein